jgi:hypothetical protein
LWVGGVAAAASLGLGTAFAHALPVHSASSQSTTGSSAGGAPAGGAVGHNPGPAGSSPAAGHRQRRHRHRSKLTAPAQRPAPTQAPPVVSSGGS